MTFSQYGYEFFAEVGMLMQKLSLAVWSIRQSYCICGSFFSDQLTVYSEQGSVGDRVCEEAMVRQ